MTAAPPSGVARIDGSRPYGADPTGLVYGYHFDVDGRAQPIDAAQAAHWLAQPGSGFVWLHFDASHNATRNWLAQHLQLPDEFAEALADGSRSTRLEQVQDGLVAVLNDVVYDLLRQSSLLVATLWLAIGPGRYLISLRNKPLRSLDRLRQAVNSGTRFDNPMALLVHLLQDQADVLGQILRQATERIDAIEDRFLDERLPDRAQLGQLRRDLVRLQRLLAPEPGALFRLLSKPPGWVAAADADELRQASEEFSLVLRDLAGLQERIKLIQEEVIALTGEKMNRTIFVLTAVTVLALPINLTAGLFGMNVGGIPLNQHPWGFWIVLLIVAAFTAAAAWVMMRSRD